MKRGAGLVDDRHTHGHAASGRVYVGSRHDEICPTPAVTVPAVTLPSPQVMAAVKSRRREKRVGASERGHGAGKGCARRWREARDALAVMAASVTVAAPRIVTT